MVCICGSIPLKSIDRGLGMHHTMADGTWDRFLGAYAQVTAAQARLTPHNAVTEIDRLILTAWREKLPVYVELPSDIAYLDIEVPRAPLVLAQPPSDPERLRSCTTAIAGHLSAATSPAVLVDLDANRFGVAADVMGLAEKTQHAVPHVTNRAVPQRGTTAAGTHAVGSTNLTQAAYWQAIQGYLRAGDVLLLDNGTSYALLGLHLPPDCTFIGSVNWGSIGYSVGALLGTLTAAPDRRHLLFLGDGSFQLTAQELSTILRRDRSSSRPPRTWRRPSARPTTR